MNKLRIAINGFGRIGRNILRAYLEYLSDYPTLEIVAINDIAEPETLLHLLKYDSTHGRLSNLGVKATLDDHHRLVIHQGTQSWSILLLQCPDPTALPWGEHHIDLALECTGQFREYRSANWHRQAGAKQVIIGAAPFDKVDACIVMGVNDEQLTRQLPIISGVSCTTQALVPLLWVLDHHFGIRSAMLTEIHAVTADQTVLDSHHRDWRRARASGHNIIPTTSSSINATIRVLPHMNHKINGHSIRVPTINVAAIDLSVLFTNTPSTAALIGTLKNACTQQLAGIMAYCDEPLVSSDFIHNRHSLIIDGEQIMTADNQFKLFAWYDNEWGYANRLLDMCQCLAHKS